jgi:hypothetical protein
MYPVGMDPSKYENIMTMISIARGGAWKFSESYLRSSPPVAAQRIVPPTNPSNQKECCGNGRGDH